MVRLLHTADWHLGRPFFGLSLLEDQAAVLDQLVDLARREKVDALLLAGDVFDRAVPSVEAVSLLDKTLTRLVKDEGIPVVLIAGNHDSPERIQYGHRLLEDRGLIVAGDLRLPLKPFVLSDKKGSLEIWPLPYADPALVRERTGDNEIQRADQAFAALLASIQPGKRSVLVAHAYLSGTHASPSERPLSIREIGEVQASHAKDFSYVAMGHLHRPQSVGRYKKIRYSGSLLAYSFEEAGQPRGVTLVDIDGRGRASVEEIPLTPPHPLEVREGTLAKILKEGREKGGSEAYLLVRLLDKGPLLNSAEKIRAYFPGLLHIEREFFQGQADFTDCKPFKMGDLELYDSFFHQMTGQVLDQEEKGLVTSILDKLEQERREG